MATESSSGLRGDRMLEQASVTDTTQAHVDEVAKRGWTVIEDAIDLDLLDALAADLERLERQLQTQPADNSFEGRNTLRIYNLLARGEIWWQVPVHPVVLP